MSQGKGLLHPLRKQPQGRDPISGFGSHIHHVSDPTQTASQASWS